MNYTEALAYIYAHLPMYSRIGAPAYKKDLHNTIALCNLLHNPQQYFTSIHIAGTNGKGSTSHMLAAILQKAGYKTGLYTSPHLKDFRERIRINGEMISPEFVTDFISKHREDFETIQPSFFEMSVGMCFEYFKHENVDIAVIETGLGGRLDSTNIISPILSIITNISFDHKDLLGDTLEKIAYEKAGIIKKGIPAIIGERDKVTENIFKETAVKQGAPAWFAEELFEVVNSSEKEGTLILAIRDKNTKEILELNLDLPGSYQLKNVLTVLSSIHLLKHQRYVISNNDIQYALSNVKALTGLRGRWDILSSNPLTIADVGHNEAGIGYIIQQLNSLHKKNIHFVLGFVKEKDIRTILVQLPKDGRYYFCKPNIERGLDAELLKQYAQEFKLKGLSYPTVNEALTTAKQAANSDDVIFIGGSTFVVAEAL